MKLNKYSKHKGVTYATYGTSSSSSNSGYGNNPDNGGSTGGSGDLDRWIWGNKDDGGDIDETMFVAGSVYVQKESLLDPDDGDDDGDKDDEGSDPDYQPYPDDDGGNIYAEGEIQAPEMYATKTLYIPHPDTKVKTDIIELFKDCVIEAEAVAEEPLYLDTNIENNKLTITGSVDTYSKSEIDNKINNIKVDSGDTYTKTEIDSLINTLKYGDSTNPIVLATGYIYPAGSGWGWLGSRKDKITSIYLSVTGGLMTIELDIEDGSSVTINSCLVILQLSGDTLNGSSATNVDGSGEGAHWFESFWDYNKIYIREFHQNDDNTGSDGWISNVWNDDIAVRRINVIITGYIDITQSYSNPIVSLSYPITTDIGGTLEPTLTYSLSWIKDGVLQTPITTGATVSYSLVENLLPDIYDVTVDSSSGIVTVTPNSIYTTHLSNIATVSVTVVMNGRSTTETVTISKGNSEVVVPT